MTIDTDSLSAILPHPIPQQQPAQLALFTIRRMAIGGLTDAHAANALLGRFGKSYRRPLVLLRALMAELARGAKRPIVVAPCCCARMTQAETMLLSAITAANADAGYAHEQLSILSGTGDCIGALTSAQAVSQAFADLGQPLNPLD
ncbi:MAG: hypothetical protein ABS87_07525 [Sphingomonas sp. SCN 67-18]|nr:DUF6628 family protein [Sphingomonas sp. SCN 67-18]ODU21214.1 MAG: hypothetical protein ABS87_07525 [Sphingomonas sp. SCN 67-18]